MAAGGRRRMKRGMRMKDMRRKRRFRVRKEREEGRGEEEL